MWTLFPCTASDYGIVFEQANCRDGLLFLDLLTEDLAHEMVQILLNHLSQDSVLLAIFEVA